MKSLLLAASIIIATGAIAVAQGGPGSGNGSGYGSGAGTGIQPGDRGAVAQPGRDQAGDAPLDRGSMGDPGKPSAERNRPDPADTNSGSVQPGSVGEMGSGSRQ
jgi:hypothetical protein